jgi:membrane associated rhomboid family serine protease
LLELGLGVFGTQQGVAHFAHLGGMAAGFLLILYWRHAPGRSNR